MSTVEERAARAAYMREWNRRNPEKLKASRLRNAERRKTRFRTWQLANREHLNAYKENNPEKRAKWNERARAYAKEHLRERLQYENERRARMLGVGYEKVDYDVIEARDKGICGICHYPIIDEKVIFDHIIPLSKGGTHNYDNLQCAHWACNAHKGNRLPVAA